MFSDVRCLSFVWSILRNYVYIVSLIDEEFYPFEFVDIIFFCEIEVFDCSWRFVDVEILVDDSFLNVLNEFSLGHIFDDFQMFYPCGPGSDEVDVLSVRSRFRRSRCLSVRPRFRRSRCLSVRPRFRRSRCFILHFL